MIQRPFDIPARDYRINHSQADEASLVFFFIKEQLSSPRPKAIRNMFSDIEIGEIFVPDCNILGSISVSNLR